MGTLITTVAPSGLPVTMAEARTQCRLYSDTSHDTTLQRLIESATEEFERMTGMHLAQRTAVLYLDGFETLEIDLQVTPVQSITHVKYDDASNVEQTLAVSTEYYASLHGPCPYIRPVSLWPTTYANKPDSVRVTMTTGYAPGGSPTVYGHNVPEDIRQAILLMVYDGWNNPGDVVTGVPVTSTKAVQSIANRYRRYL